MDPEAQDRVYMQRALAEAEAAAQEEEVPVGAVIVCDGQVVGCRSQPTGAT